MVVPIVYNYDVKSSSKLPNKRKKFVGDGKRIRMGTNSDTLLIIGNGNSVDIERNDGDVEILGDGCRISIIAGTGRVKYTGDGGILYTGTMNMENIQYRGDGGRIQPSISKHLKNVQNVPNTNVENVYIQNRINLHINICSLKKVCK